MTDSPTSNAKRYDLQECRDRDGARGYRITDTTTDSRVATSYVEAHARIVCDALNTTSSLRDGINTAIELIAKEIDWYDDDSGNPPHELEFLRRMMAHLNGTLLESDGLPLEPCAAPVAWVPVHPTNGPLWANTIATKTSDHPSHYPLMPLYNSPAQPPCAALTCGCDQPKCIHGNVAQSRGVAAEILRKRLEHDDDLLLRAGVTIREAAEFAGDDHSVGLCNCQDMRLVDEIELRLGRIGVTKATPTKEPSL